MGSQRVLEVLSGMATLILLGVFGALLHLSPAGQMLNNRLHDWRMAMSPVQPSGQVAFVAIDAASLREVGAWPWSRDIHAELLDRLIEAGARDVFFDIDFNLARSPEGDAAFATALDRAGGTVFLAVFAQRLSRAPDAIIGYNQPNALFRDVSWPAAVNITPAPDGLIRQYMAGVSIDDTFVPSVGALLSGGAITDGDAFNINFAISPGQIPTFSAANVFSGGLDPGVLQGRSIIIGSSAAELGDFHAVPLHGVVPGAMIHALATETMLADLAFEWTSPAVVIFVLLATLLVLNQTLANRPWRMLGALGLGLLAIEFVALTLFRHSALALPTGVVHPMAIAFIIGRLASTLNLNIFLLLRRSQEVKNTETLLRHVFDHSSDGLVVVTECGKVLTHSRSVEAMFGLDPEGVVDLPPTIWQTARAVIAAPDQTRATELHSIDLPGAKGGRSIEYLVAPSSYGDLETLDANGASETRSIATISARDVTDLKQREREIAYLSTHDDRTGALRRSTFLEFLRIRLAYDGAVGVLVLNLSRFKSLNVTMGRDVGDAVLSALVGRLQEIGEGLSAVARLDGDSFALFTELPGSLPEFQETIEKLVACVERPYDMGGAQTQVGVRIGYEWVEGDDDATAETALARAEEALDHARTRGAATICRYDAKMAQFRARRREIERAMPAALDRREFSVLYQPQHRLSDGALVGVEALVRWDSAELGRVYPDEFISIAEQTGMIVELGRQILMQSVHDAQHLPQSVAVAVNVSGVQIKQGDICGDVAEALRVSGLDPSRLCLELTESVLMDDVDDTVEKMRDATWLGITWALDDFGTGYSSIAYLTRLPLAKLKLDRSFTDGLGDDPAVDAILSSMVALSKGLGLCLLCEGVETSRHARTLKELGCAEVQGYLYGKPQPISDIVSASRRDIA